MLIVFGYIKHHMKHRIIGDIIFLDNQGEVGESFQLQMGFSFPFLRAKYLRTSLLIMRSSSFLTLLYVGDTYARLVYTWYKNIFRMIAVLIIFFAVN